MALKNLRRFYNKALRDPSYALRVFHRRSRAYFYYCFRSETAPLPEAITLFLTHRCNLHCKMCGQWGEGGITKKLDAQHIREELPFETFKALMDTVASFKPNITLFGGEPLLYAPCLDLIRYIRQKGMHCVMITNGYMLRDIAEELIESGPDELNVSIDGGKDLHDEIRGMPGLFETITSGLKEISRIKKEKKRKKPFVNLQCTITKYNYRRLEELIEVAKMTDADALTFHNLIFLGDDVLKQQQAIDDTLSNSSLNWEGFKFAPEIDVEELYVKMKIILRENQRIDFYPNFSLKGLRQYYQNPSGLPAGYPARCLSPWIVAYIFPDGEVRPCLNFSYTFGNIKEGNFQEIWNSPEAARYRKTLKTSKIFPVCARCTELYRY